MFDGQISTLLSVSILDVFSLSQSILQRSLASLMQAKSNHQELTKVDAWPSI